MRPWTDWVSVLAPGPGTWKVAYPEVAARVRVICAMLASEGPGSSLSTTELVEVLYPEIQARGPEAIPARARLHKAIAAMAPNELRDVCTKADKPAYSWYGHPVRPWRWHVPKTIPCPHCAGTGRLALGLAPSVPEEEHF